MQACPTGCQHIQLQIVTDMQGCPRLDAQGVTGRMEDAGVGLGGAEGGHGWDGEQVAQAGVGEQGDEDDEDTRPNKADAQLRQWWQRAVAAVQPDFPSLHGEGAAGFRPVGFEVEPPASYKDNAGNQAGKKLGNGVEENGDDAGKDGGDGGYGAGQQQLVHKGGKAAFDGGRGKGGHGGLVGKKVV